MDKTIVTTFNCVGTGETKNNFATFSLALKAKSESLESAKLQVREKSAHILERLKKFKMTLDGDIQSTFANFKLEHREQGEHYGAGFLSTCVLTWTVLVDQSAIDDIHNYCLEVDTNSSEPQFFIKDVEPLSQIARQRAVDSAKKRLVEECDLLGINSSKLKVLSWNFEVSHLNKGQITYSSSMGPMGVTGPQGPIGGSAYASRAPSAPVKLATVYQESIDPKALEPGNTSVTVSLRISYVWE